MAILDQVSMRIKTIMSTPNYPTTIGSKELFTLLQLHHVKNIWVHRTFSYSFLYCHSTFFFLGKPLHSYLKVPLWLWIKVVSPLAAPLWLSHSITCHGLILGVQPGDQMSLAHHAQH